MTPQKDRTPTHVQLLNFRKASWQKSSAIAEIAVALGLVDEASATVGPEAAVARLRDCVDEALDHIRVREIDVPPPFDRSFFFAGSLLLRRAELLGPDDEALLRRNGLANKKLEWASASGIETRRAWIAAKWKKEARDEPLETLTFKTHHEHDVFVELAREVDAVIARQRPGVPVEPTQPNPGLSERCIGEQPSVVRGATDDPPSDYRRTLAHHLQRLYAAHAPASGRAALSLDQAFIGLPVDLAITVEVGAGRVCRWALTRVDSEGDDYRTAREEAFDVEVTDSLTEVAAELVDELDREVEAGTEWEHIEGLGRPGILADPAADGVKWNVRPLLVEDVARAHRLLLLLGVPGSGKSTVARHMALAMCEGTPFATSGSLPIYASLRDLATSPSFKHWPAAGALPTLWDHVGHELGLSEATKTALSTRVADGRVLVILDGLDELPTPNRSEDAAALDALLERFVLTLAESVEFLLVTSRPPGASRWPLEPLTRYHLAPLRAPERAQLANRLLRASALNGGIAGFMHALRSVPSSLKDRPLFVQLMAAIYMQSTSSDGDGMPRLPHRRSRLYRESVKLLLDRWTRPQDIGLSLTERLGCSAEELYRRLAVIAYETQASTPTGTDVGVIPFPLLLTHLIKLEGEPDVRAVLAYLSQVAGALAMPAPDTYEFAHKGFQEFLAAAYLATQDDGARVACEHIADDVERWREPCLMLGEALLEDGTRGDLWAYVEELLAAARESFGPLWLAARLVRDETDADDRERVRNAPLVNLLRTATTDELATQRASPVIDRFDLGSALDVIGDARPGVGLIEDAPDISWCRVPAGESQVGSSPEEAATILDQDWAAGWALDRETPGSTHHVGELSVSRYPITVAQFRAFLNAEDGYAQEEWWSAAGLHARGEDEPLHPLGSLDVDGNLPATFVSWYDAAAFCRWASARLGTVARLPREDEWERIARGPAMTIFPWGNDFDHAACNSQAANVGAVMAVGFCPTGAAMWDADGVHDLCGNVWEWTSTAWENGADAPYNYPYQAGDGRESEELPPAARRVVRGGSYLNGAFLCRAAYRGRDHPATRLGRQGFRIVSDAA